MKHLSNHVQRTASSWVFDQTPEGCGDCHQVTWKRGLTPALMKIASLVLPILMISFAAESVEAWEKKTSLANTGKTLESVSSKPTVISPTVNHEIQPGDTLWELSQEYKTSPQTIAKYNAIAPKELLQIGETIEIPLTNGFSLEQPQVLQSPLVAIGGAFPLEGTEAGITISDSPASQLNFGEHQFTSPVPRIIAQGEETATLGFKPSQHSSRREASPQLPIQQFLADVDQLQANYGEIDTLDRNQGKVAAPRESSSQDVSSGDSIATAPMKVEFYNRFLIPPVGETVSPQLPPLSSPDQYLPNSPQKFNGYIWPAKGVFTSGYGMRWGRMHRGIDIAAPIGTPILAAAPGEVVVAGWHSGGYGKLVKLKHPDGSLTLYAHNNRILVSKGQEVDQGQQIAEMGSTGRSTGPHLHFEIHPSGKGAVNPLAYLPKR